MSVVPPPPPPQPPVAQQPPPPPQPPVPPQPPAPPQPQGVRLSPKVLIGIIAGAGVLIILITISVFAALLPPVLQVPTQAPTQVPAGEGQPGGATGVQDGALSDAGWADWLSTNS